MARVDSLHGAVIVNETSEYGASGAGRALGEEVKAGAREAVEAGKERTRSFLEEQKATLASQVDDLAGMLRRAVRDQAGEGGASTRLAERAADGMQRLAESLHQRDLRQLVHGCEEFARRSPAMFVGGAMTAGFLLTRFLKSSRERRENGGRHAVEFGHQPSIEDAEGYPTYTTDAAGRAY